MSTIQFRGPLATFWALWVTTAVVVSLWGPWAWGVEETRFAYRVLLTVFLPMELLGAFTGRRDGPERVRTLSQLMQLAAQQAKPGSAWWQSWKALASGFVMMLAFAVGWVVWEVHPALGVLAGLTVLWWNLYHWLNRGKHG